MINVSEQLSKIKNISWRMVYFMLVAFLLVNISLFVQSNQVNAYTTIIVVYTLIIGIFKDFIDKEQEKPLFTTLGRDLLIFSVFYIFFTIIPFQSLPVAPIFQFESVLFAWIFFTVVAFSETLVYVIAIPKKIGIIWASIFFAIMHVATDIVLANGFHLIPVLSYMLTQFIANLGFWYLYRRSQSLFLTSMVHVMFNLAQLGILVTFTGGLI